MVSKWQFNEPNETWYVYHLEIPAPDLIARLDGFDAAWNAGDESNLVSQANAHWRVVQG